MHGTGWTVESAVRLGQALYQGRPKDGGPMAIFVAVPGPGRRFRFTELNAAAEYALGLPVQILRQFCFDEDAVETFEGEVLPSANGNSPGGIIKHFLKCLDTVEPIAFEGPLNLQPEPGEQRFRVKLFPLGDHGAVTHVVGFAQLVGSLA